MENLRLLVADDDYIARKGVRAYLEEQPGWEVVAEASNGSEAVERAKLLRPDVTILDLSMPELNGLEVTREIVKSPEVDPRVVICSLETDPEIVQVARQAGAMAYVFKMRVERDLIMAVKLALLGKPFVSQGPV